MEKISSTSLQYIRQQEHLFSREVLTISKIARRYTPTL